MSTAQHVFSMSSDGAYDLRRSGVTFQSRFRIKCLNTSVEEHRSEVSKEKFVICRGCKEV